MGEWAKGRKGEEQVSGRLRPRLCDFRLCRPFALSPIRTFARWRGWRLIGPFLGVLCLLIAAVPASGTELWSGGDQRYDLTATLKCTSLLSHAPEDSVLYPERWSAASLGARYAFLRVALLAHPNRLCRVSI